MQLTAISLAVTRPPMSGEVTPDILFRNGEHGLILDNSNGIAAATLFQDSAGTTPVTAVEQPVGLRLDTSKGLVLGPDLTTIVTASNGSLNAAFAVGPGTQIVITNGPASTLGAYIAGGVSAPVANRWYKATVVLASVANGSVRLVFSGGGIGVGPTWTAPGTYTTILNSQSSGSVYVESVAANTTATIASVSIHELPGNHAYQATSASRGTLRARYNRLTYSEDFSNAAWTKDNVTVSQTTAPDGSALAWMLTDNTSGGFHRLYYTVPTNLAAPYKISVKLKPGLLPYAYIRLDQAAGGFAFVWINWSTSIVSTTGTDITAAIIITLSNGWKQVTFNYTPSSANFYPNMMIGTSEDGINQDYVGTGVVSLNITAVDLRLTIDAVPGIPSYQRINAATDYDTVGFPHYIEYDGVDDSYQTAAIDFSGTNAVTMWHAGTALAENAMVVELSANSSANNGSFWYYKAGNTADAYRKGNGAGVETTTGLLFVVPSTRIFAYGFDLAGTPEVFVRRLDAVGVVTGTQESTDSGAGPMGNYPLYIGRRNNASLPFTGREHCLIVRGAASTATEITSIERALAVKQGRTL